MAAWRGIVFFFFAGRLVRCRHRALTEKLVTCQTARFWPGSNSPSPLPSEIFDESFEGCLGGHPYIVDVYDKCR